MHQNIEPEGRIKSVLWAGWMMVIGLMFTAFFFRIMEKITWSMFFTLYTLPYVIWAVVTVFAYVVQFKMNLTVGSHRKEKEDDWRRGGKRKYRYSGAADSGRWDKGKIWDVETGKWESRNGD